MLDTPQTALANVLLKHADFTNHAELAPECADGILRDLKAAGWVLVRGLQPMETAPRDASRFWGLEDDNLISMLWHPDFQAFVSSWRRMEMAPGYTIDGKTFSDHSPVVHHPRAWMLRIPEDRKK